MQDSAMMEDHFARPPLCEQVCIVGLGLMGGSLGMALRAAHACRIVTGADRDEDVCRQALALGAVDHAGTDAAAPAGQADVVILATPVRSIARLVAELGPLLKPGALLLDIGSTKSAIVRAMGRLPAQVQAVGGHPMCGKEKSGIAAAEAGLFRDKVFCLTPLPRTTKDSLARAESLARAVGARPLVIDEQRHDALVSVTSHLPYLMAAALTETAGNVAAIDALAWQLAASGFRDTSRLAGSDVDMMVDILMTNRQNISERARQAAGHLLELAAAIDDGDEARLRLLLQAARRTWRQAHQPVAAQPTGGSERPGGGSDSGGSTGDRRQP